MDEDDLDYEQSDDEDLSDIDDSDLLNRLEAKYGKISSNNDKSNEEENDDSSWTSKCFIHSYYSFTDFLLFWLSYSDSVFLQTFNLYIINNSLWLTL